MAVAITINRYQYVPGILLRANHTAKLTPRPPSPPPSPPPLQLRPSISPRPTTPSLPPLPFPPPMIAKDPELLVNDMASPAPRADTTTPRRSSRPLDDLQLLCRSTPGSSASSRGGGGGGGGGGSGGGYRNSLGTLSEWGEGRDAAASGEEEGGGVGEREKTGLGGGALAEEGAGDGNKEALVGGEDAGGVREAVAAATEEG